MINYNQTRMGLSYTQYIRQYLEGLARGVLETSTLNETSLLGVNRKKGELPKTNLPYVVPNNTDINTRNQTLVLGDVSGLRGEEADLRYTNMILTALWEDPNIGETFVTTRKFAAKAFMHWYGRNLMTRFNLNYEDMTKINILAAIYYYCSTSTPEDMLKESNYKVYADLGEVTGVGVNRVINVIKEFNLEKHDGNFTIEHLISMMNQVSDDTKGKITYQSVTSTLAHSWYGEGGVFYCNLATEYPPMFLTLLYYALVDKSVYGKTRFSVLVNEFAVGRKSNVGEAFTRQLHSIIKNVKLKAD